MQAIVIRHFGGPETLVLESVPSRPPGPGEVAVAVGAAGLNFIDIYERTGAYAVDLPFTPGREAAGTVREVGSGVTDLAPGDRVAYATQRGAYAEETTVSADRLVRVPDGVDLDVAAALMLQGMTAHYLTRSTFPLAEGHTASCPRCRGRRGTSARSTGQGPGRHCHRNRVHGREGPAGPRGGCGSRDPLQPRLISCPPRWSGPTEGVWTWCTTRWGATRSPGASSRCGPGGMLALYGQSSGRVDALDPQLLNKQGSVFLTRPSLKDHVATANELRSRADELFGLVMEGALNVRVDQTFPLAEAGAAQAYMEARKTRGKVLLRPGG